MFKVFSARKIFGILVAPIRQLSNKFLISVLVLRGVKFVEALHTVSFVHLCNALISETADIQLKLVISSRPMGLQPYFRGSRQKSVVDFGEVDAPKTLH